MLHKGQHSGKIQDIGFSTSSSPYATPYAALPRRHSLTAKSKNRKMMGSDHKTISINPDPSTPAYITNVPANHSEQFLPKSSFSFHSNPKALSQFDNLHIEDFLKHFIVGEKKIPEDKSHDIIRSLNGTWFKNTQSSQLPASKLYNSLGIKRNKIINSRPKQWNSFADSETQKSHFSKQYTPPNVFPGKKIGSKQVNPSKHLIEAEFSRLNLSEHSPLKINIMKKLNSSPPRTTSPKFRRSQSQFQKKKSQLISKKQVLDASDGLIKGYKMKLHKD